MKITSPANPRIKSVVRLGKKKERLLTGLMAVEGIREISRAATAGVVFREAYFCPEIASGRDAEKLLADLGSRGAYLVEVSAAVFDKLAYREGAGGIVAVAERGEHSLESLRLGENTLVIVVDHLEKPGNLGAVFRSADGSGADAVIVSDPSAELSNPNVIRASLGTVFTVQSAVAPAAAVIDFLRERGILIVATAPEAELEYCEADLSSPCAVVVGSEDRGLGDEWLNAADVKVTIPMRGAADSLNASAAAAILLYEALRQRK
jgi:TrmH family RNA methyltransferase